MENNYVKALFEKKNGGYTLFNRKLVIQYNGNAFSSLFLNR